VKLLPRRTPPEPTPADEEPVEATDSVRLGKGRPTPKRRDTAPQRGPVTAPKTRKEALARQKQQAKAARQARKSASSGKPMTAQQRRDAMRSGDPALLPRRDQGPTRKLARDYVDSRIMLSNYLLVIFVLLILGSFVPVLATVAPLAILVIIVDCYVAGRRIRSLSIERFGKADGGTMGIGYYAISRAFLPRRWRLPPPQVQRGDAI
jgi:hypothetical protein